jgi:hypothetical protein
MMNMLVWSSSVETERKQHLACGRNETNGASRTKGREEEKRVRCSPWSNYTDTEQKAEAKMRTK